MVFNNWHGTTVAGFAAGQTTDSNLVQPTGARYASIGYNNKIIPFQKNDMLGKALFASTKMHADVISISAFETCDMSDSTKLATTSILKEILDNGSVIVTGAGNGFCNGCYKDTLGVIHPIGNCDDPGDFAEFTPPYPFSPLLDSRIISVTGVTSGDSLTRRVYDTITHQYHISTWSYFDEVDVSSPGYDLWGLQPTMIRIIDTIYGWDTTNHQPWVFYDTTYIKRDRPFWNGYGGTSFATPIVAGLASLIKAHAPWLTAAEVEDYIKNYANVDAVLDANLYRNPLNNKKRTGTGRINAYKALQEIENFGQNYLICDSTEVIWNDTVYVKDTVKICSGSVLRVRSDVFFRPSARVIIECGGKLIVDGGRLTGSLNHLWKGVLAFSNSEAIQTPTEQSVVNVINNGIIENAETAISAVQYGYDPDHPTYTNGGAIIICSDALFKNNVCAIKLNPYKSSSFSRFNKCTFINEKENLEFNLQFAKFIELNSINGVQIKGCSFENSAYEPIGYGIYSYNSRFIVDEYCESTISPCPEADIVKSSFINLDYGIYSFGSAGLYTARVENTLFDKNATGAYASGIVGLTFNNNQLNVRLDSSNITNAHICGLYLDGSTAYEVTQNKFYFTGFGNLNKKKIGMIINNSGPENNFIKDNLFYNLDYGIHAQGQNRSRDGLTGLEIRCNKFNDCYNDISVFGDTLNTPNLGIKMFQGNLIDTCNSDPSGNIFSRKSTNYFSIANNAYFSPITYLHHRPQVINDKVVPDPVIQVKLQRSYFAYDSIYSCFIENGGTTKEEMISNINSLKDQYVEDYESYILIVDNGNSDSIVEEIEFSYPSNATELQFELLNISPYLSDSVIFKAIKKEGVFNNAMVRDLLIANTHSIKQEKIINAVDERFEPMPDEMYNQILSMADSVSLKEIKECKMSMLKTIMDDLYNRLLKDYHSNGTIDSLLLIYDSLNSIKAKVDKALVLATKGELDNAYYTISQIPEFFIGYDSLDYIDYIWYFEKLAQYNSIDSIPSCELDNHNFTNEVIKAFNRNARIHKHEIDYMEPYLFSCQTKASKTRHQYLANKNVDDKGLLKVFPNPTNGLITIAYTLPENTQSAQLRLYDVQGNQKFIKYLRDSYDEQIIILEELPGTYILELSDSNKKLDSVKITIVK